MGLFDESDSDDDIPATANKSCGVEDEEEDTLEAYMNSLNDNDNASSSNNNYNNCSGGEGRLDVDAEDEATSHWNVDEPNVNGSGSGSSKLLPKHEDTNVKQKAESTTMSGFVRAGGNNKQPSQDNTQDDDDDKFTNLKEVREHQKQMIHTEIDPLESINHNTIQYNTFNKIFYKPNNTKEGHAWRKEHDVICTPSNFDPILGFGELSGSDGVFPDELIKTIAQSGYDAPTIVQSQTLSVALSGNDALITVSVMVYNHLVIEL